MNELRIFLNSASDSSSFRTVTATLTSKSLVNDRLAYNIREFYGPNLVTDVTKRKKIMNLKHPFIENLSGD